MTVEFKRSIIGIDGILDTKFLQDWQRYVVTAIVDPRQRQATIFDKILFGIPPNRIKKYIEDRFDLITVNRYRRESQRQEPDYDQLVGMVDVTGETPVILRQGIIPEDEIKKACQEYVREAG